MPTYAYTCTACQHSMEVRQSFTDDALTVCPECAGRLRKRFDNVGVVFKGSGFYRNDSRAPEGSSGSKGSAGSEGSKGSGETKGSSAGETSSKPSDGGSTSGSGSSGSGSSSSASGSGSGGSGSSGSGSSSSGAKASTGS